MSDNSIYDAPKADLGSDVKLAPEEAQKILSIAKRQKALIYVLLAYILLFVISATASPTILTYFKYFAWPVMLAVAIFTAMLCWKVYGRVAAVIMVILSIVPGINILVMLAASGRSNTTISSAGFKVGILGAKIAEIETVISACSSQDNQ